MTIPRPFLTAAWRDLLMLNWPVDPALLAPHVPRGVALDRWAGETWVSIVAFRFLDTRVLGVPVPWHRDFDEANLRFYVRRDADDGPRRAVTFLRELVPRRAIAWTARLAYHEPYRAVPMRHARAATADGLRLEYAWRDGPRWTAVAARVTGAPAPLVDGSAEEFITEHYWGYTRQRDGGTVEYRVAHPRWRTWPAADVTLSGDLEPTYGPAFARALSGPPASAFVAEGSAVAASWPTRIA
jgi:hypothetical protein